LLDEKGALIMMDLWHGDEHLELCLSDCELFCDCEAIDEDYYEEDEE
jgi:hypothetical protein